MGLRLQFYLKNIFTVEGATYFDLYRNHRQAQAKINMRK
jgi:hypothetical protein